MATGINLNFHSQLRSILDILAVKAVKEISKLVDDGFAVLHVEICRRQEENEALKCKIQTMELQIAEKSGAPEQPAKCRSSVQCDQFKTTDSLLVKQINVGLWEDGELNAEQEETPEEPSGMKGECADMEARRTEPLLIKEERLEEDSVVLGEMNIREKRAVDLRACVGERSCVQETQGKPANHTEEVSEMQSTRYSVREVGEGQSSLKRDPDNSNVNKRIQYGGSGHFPGGLHHLESESVMFERTNQQGPFLIPEVGDTQTGPETVSYTPETSSENPLVHLVDAPSDMNGCDSLDTCFISPQGEKAQCRDVTTNKLFVCKYCGKHFSRRNLLINHHRVHTGEKPFSCSMCGKRFSDSSNRKKHQSIHTGEKPFRCGYCGKQFSDSSSRKRHQSVHTGKKPFNCIECGKCFTRLCHLRSHCQQFHSWQIPFSEHRM